MEPKEVGKVQLLQPLVELKCARYLWKTFLPTKQTHRNADSGDSDSFPAQKVVRVSVDIADLLVFLYKWWTRPIWFEMGICYATHIDKSYHWKKSTEFNRRWTLDLQMSVTCKQHRIKGRSNKIFSSGIGMYFWAGRLRRYLNNIVSKNNRLRLAW